MKERILIVDNDRDMLTLLQEHLENEHWQVNAVSSGAEACARLAREEFALVLTDLVMEPVDGLAVLQEAQRLRPRTHVVVMTAYAAVERAIDAMRNGAYHYVTKPFNPSELTLIARRALEDQRLRSENRQLREEVHLAEQLLERTAAALRKRIEGFEEGATKGLPTHHCSGNVRELENVVERAATLARAPLISQEELRVDLDPAPRDEPGLRPTLAELEIQYIRRVLADTKGDKRRAAEILGISVRTLQRMQAMSKLGDGSTLSDRAS